MISPRLIGFSMREFLWNVKCSFEETFQREGAANNVLNTIKFVSVADFGNYEDEYDELPALYLDLYEARINPLNQEYSIEGEVGYSNSGDLPIYLFMRAMILIDNIMINPHLLIRQLSFYVAGHIIHEQRFNSKVGMAEVTHVQPSKYVTDRSNRVIEWEVLWQHLVTIEKPQLNGLFNITDDMAELGYDDVNTLLLSMEPDGTGLDRKYEELYSKVNNE